MSNRTEAAKTMKVMFEKEGMTFANEDGWNALAEHVDVHNRYLNEQLKYNVSWDDALFSWYENIYTPLKRAISSWSVKTAFSEYEIGELYLAVSDHWFYLKERYPEIDADTAAANFVRTYKDGITRFFSRFLYTNRTHKQLSFS